jgi:prepilin signal peptidase PulO-like enzyme (type II secretory pathway)
MKMLTLPAPQKFNIFNTFTIFDVDSGHSPQLSAASRVSYRLFDEAVRRYNRLVLTIAVSAIIGFLLGGASWVTAEKLTAGARVSPRPERAVLFLAGASGAVVLALSAVRSVSNAATVGVVAILMTPLLITLLTDVLARLVFPVVIVPGLLAGLALAAVGPQGVPLPAALISGGGAALIAALLVAASRRIWSGGEEPALGSGEILIAATIGAMLGPDETPTVLFAGVMLGAVMAGLLLLTGRARQQDPMPYGAFLCGCALVALAL